MRSLVGAVVGAATRQNTSASTPDTPVPYTPAGLYQGRFVGQQRDRTAQLRAVEQNPLLFSIVNRTSTAVAELTWRLYRKTPNPEVTTDRVEVFSHPLLSLLRKPNSFMSGASLFERSQQHVDLTGEGYWAVNKLTPTGLPLELWPIAPNRMDPVKHDKKFMTGWIYTGLGGEEIPLRLDEVIQFQMPNPSDPYRGLGPVQAMLLEIEAYRYSVEWNRNFFINSAMPGGIIRVPKNLSDPEFDKLVTRWNEQHKGVSRAQRVGILEDAEWQDIGLSQRDMQFAELQTQSRDRMMEGYGISGAVMGVTEDVNRSNAEAGKAMFAELLTVPRANRFKGGINALLLPQYGKGADDVYEVDFDSPVPKDVELENQTLTAKANAASVFVMAGWAPDDVLEQCELAPMKYVGPPKGATAPPPPPQQDDALEPAAVEPPAARWALPGPRNADQATGDQQHPDLTAVDEQWQHATTQLVSQYQADVVPAQRQALLDQIRDVVAAGTVGALGALVLDHKAAAALVATAMTAYAHTAAAQVTREAQAQGVDGVQPAQPQSEQLQEIADVVCALLAAELAVSAGREAMRVWHEGMTGQQLADHVGPYLASLSDAGARQHLGGAMQAAQNAARTATLRAAPKCQIYAREELDRNTCRPCRDVNGRLIGENTDPDIAAKIQALYPGGGYVLCEGRDRCRGTISALWLPPTGAEKPQPPTSSLEPALLGSALRELWHTQRINGHERPVPVA